MGDADRRAWRNRRADAAARVGGGEDRIRVKTEMLRVDARANQVRRAPTVETRAVRLDAQDS
jgi:hypothetical protein